MDSITIRNAKAHDVDAIADLWEQLVAYHRAVNVHLPSATANGSLRYARRILDQLDSPTSCVLVAETEDKQVIGYVLGVIVDLAPEMFEQEPSGFLADIFVLETHRRHGVGKKLVTQLVEWFAQRGVKYYELHAASNNQIGLAFWRSVGGTEVMVRMRAEIQPQASERDE